ncbi:MAG: type IVB secretion system apparatus protein IcmL/DotI [Alphaproteobacteria bacterium]|nr:type IVB secretion system apparatus protein IcmL/DotI [Alphaproteobacteria bacterium]
MSESTPPSVQNQKSTRPGGPPPRKTGAKPSPDQAEIQMLKTVGSVVVRNEFYRDGYRTLLRIAVIEAMIILALVGAMYFVIEVHQPENRYFATTEDGRLVPMVPLSEPNLSVPALMSWSAQAATEVMTFGFNDYKRRLQQASRNFTRLGWVSFTAALEKSRIIETVEANGQVVSAAPASAPILISEGLVNGRYQWQVQVPLVVTYQAGSSIRDDKMLVTLLLVRVPKLESPNGVGIEQWIAR